MSPFLFADPQILGCDGKTVWIFRKGKVETHSIGIAYGSSVEEGEQSSQEFADGDEGEVHKTQTYWKEKEDYCHVIVVYFGLSAFGSNVCTQ